MKVFHNLISQTNFFDITVIPGISDSPYASPDYPISNTSATLVHAQSSVPPPPSCANTYPTVKQTDLVDPSSTYGYNNWSNYNNFPQYAPCAQSQYMPPVPAPLVVYPQVHSIVNQNQIHLHLHGATTDKLDQFLGAENTLMLGGGGLASSAGLTRTSSSIEVGLATDNQLGLMQETEGSDVCETQESREGDSLMERPYWRTFSE